MGISMLGGILSGIGEVISKVLLGILTPLMNMLNKYIIAPLLSVLFSLISYVLSLFFYNISVFILALIDYVEILFRLLAGLEVDNMRLTLAGGESGFNDLLLQLITSESVTQAFLAMCIVGLFLLVITTIFQMIKVEYTTEGSKNAKGPILEKAFKGVANLMLLPILVVFGVFIGNQVLDLIDTATKGAGDNPSISGTLFVTAASEAFYKYTDIPIVLISPNISESMSTIVLSVFPAVMNSITDGYDAAVEGNTGGSVDAEPISYRLSDAEREQVENKFINGVDGHYYWNAITVTSYYDYSEINYLLLIFGGCIVIKTLYLSCFGMVTRLYRCAVLYIVSPMVIGMSPVNDSGMKKWQQSFIGSAISAYGVIIAINVFFIVVKILLSIDFEFSSLGTYFFGATLMEGLLKCIFVIGGCTMIEKFSKELGGYFGAEDAVSAGKELEKATKDEVKKGIEGTVKTALTVGSIAMGGAGIAASIGKQGLGGTIKSGVKNLGSKALEKGQAVADYMGVGDAFDSVVGAKKDLKSRNAENYLNEAQNQQEYNDAMQNVQTYKTQLENQNLSKSDRKAIEKRLKDSEKVVSKYENKQNIVDDYKNYTSKEGKENRATTRRAREGASKQVGHDTISNLGGWGAGISSGKEIINKAMTSYGNANGKQAQATVEAFKGQQQKEAEKRYENLYVENVKAKRIENDKKTAVKASENLTTVGSLMSSYNGLAGQLASTSADAKPVIQQQMNDLANQIRSLMGGSEIQFDTNGRITVDGMGEQDFINVKRAIQEAVNKVNDPDDVKQIANAVKGTLKMEMQNVGISDASADKLKNLYIKELEKVIKNAEKGKK